MSVTTQDVAAPVTVRAVVVSFWLYIAAAVANVLIGLSSLLKLGQIDDAVQKAQAQHPNSNLSSGALQGVGVGVIVAIVVVAVVWSVLVVVFAMQMRRGRNWARIVVTVVGALSLFAVLGFGAITVAVVAAAIVFSYLPTANAFFRPVGASTWA